MEEVPLLLKKLEINTSPSWGNMNALEMVDHLRRGVDLMLRNDIEVEIVTPLEQIPAFQHFLLSDKMFKKSSEKPKEYDLVKPLHADLEQVKLNLMKSLVAMQVHFEKHPDFKSTHPNFGELNTDLWLHMHRKHIKHHFRQFGILAI